MAINSTTGVSAAVQITSPAKNNGTISAGTSTTVTLPDSITTTNNGNLQASPTAAGRLIRMTSGAASGDVRYISVGSGAATTITVSEAWSATPSSGDSYEISYVVQDAATVNGLSLVNKRVSDYALGKAFVVQSTGFFALLDGASLEADNATSTTVAELEVESGGRFHVGYLAGGVPVSGGALYVTMTGTGDIAFDCQSGGIFNGYDLYFTSVQNTFAQINGTCTLQGTKLFSMCYGMDLTGSVTLTDAKIQGKGTTNDTIEVDDTTICNSVAVISTNGFITTNNATVQSIDLNNVTFVDTARYFLIYEKKTINLINPVNFSPTTADQTDIDFEGTNRDGVLNEKYSLDLVTVEPDGTVITSPRVFLYEGLRTDSLVLDLTGDATTGAVNNSWTYRNFTDNANTSVSVLTNGLLALRVYKYGKSPFVSAQSSTTAFNSNITLINDTAITEASQATAITNGSGITVTLHATGETDTRPMKLLHYDGGTVALPAVGTTVEGATSGAQGDVLEVLGTTTDGYVLLENWNGTEFQNNENIENVANTITYCVADLSGGGASFYKEVSWEVDCNSLTMPVVYDYLAAKMAQSTLDSTFTKVHRWGQDEQSQLLYSGADGFFSERNVGLAEGVVFINRAAGTVDYFTTDDGTQFIPPASYTFTLTGLQTDTEVRIYDVSDNSEIAGTEQTTGTLQSVDIVSGGTGYTVSDTLTVTGGTGTAATLTVDTVSGGVITGVSITSVGSYTANPQNPASVTGGTGNGATFNLTISGSFIYNYTYATDVTTYIVVFNLGYKDIRLKNLVISNENQTIPIQQIADRNYANP